LVLIRFRLVLEILWFLYFVVLPWNCLFPPIWGRGSWDIFPQIWSTIVLTLKKHPLAWKHVVWAIKREKQSSDSTWCVMTEKKGKDSKKSHKVVIFCILGEKPPLNRLKSKFAWWVTVPTYNHVCKVTRWNFQGLRFYRGLNIPFSYWFLHGPYNSSATALPVKCSLSLHRHTALRACDNSVSHIQVIQVIQPITDV